MWQLFYYLIPEDVVEDFLMEKKNRKTQVSNGQGVPKPWKSVACVERD